MLRKICLVVLFLPGIIYAEDITNVRKSPEGGYDLDINTAAYHAMPAKGYEAIKNRLMDDDKKIAELTEKIISLEAELEKSKANAAKYQQALTEMTDLNQRYKTLNDSYSDLNADYKKTANDLVVLNKSYSTTLTEFDDLVEKYRKVAIRSSPRSMLDFGVGMLKPTDSGSDTHYFVSVGSGVKLLKTEFRGWLLVGNDSYGLMAGLSF